jgi:transcriptional regulator with XRE-family HTH domain
MIRQARELAGIDQRRLASLTGISRKTVVTVEGAPPEKPDARRRAVLERIRWVFERGFDLEFTFANHPEGEGGPKENQADRRPRRRRAIMTIPARELCRLARRFG